jgi:transposase
LLEHPAKLSVVAKEPEPLVAVVERLIARIEALESEVGELRKKNEALTSEHARLVLLRKKDAVDLRRQELQNAWLRKQLFGPKRERIDPARLHAAWLTLQKQPDQVTDTDAADKVSTEPLTSMQLLLRLGGSLPTTSVTPTEPTHAPHAPDAAPASPPDGKPKPARHAHGRSKLDERLPIEELVLEPEEGIPPGARRMGQDVQERIGFRKACYVRLLIIRPKYAKDEPDGSTRVHSASTADEMIAHGLCDPAMLAHVIQSKWGDHIPWNRLSGMCARQGLALSASTLAGWSTRAEPTAKLVVDAMRAQACADSKVIAIDATTVAIRAKGACVKGYPWVMVADRTHVLMGFSARHTQDVPQKLLAGYRGHVVADASCVYDPMFEVEHGPLECGCWAHSRRKFVYAAPTDERALVGIKFADELFAIERDLDAAPPSKRKEVRLVRSKAVLEAFERWRDSLLGDVSVDERGPLIKALRYTRNHWAALCRFLDDGRIPIHNNFTELQIRHIAIGRRNWLFFGSEPHAESACTWLSLIASAKLHGLDPEKYLRDLFRVLPSWPKRRVLELAPAYWSITRARLDAIELARPLGPLTIPPRAGAEAEKAAE